MGVLDTLFLFLTILSLTFASQDCQTSTCGNKNIPIRFPFHLDKDPKTCGFPGFDLACDDRNTTVLTLPFAGEFTVRQISYITQEILLYDASGCLPGRLLRNFSLAGTPFVSAFYENYTFLLCPEAFTRNRFATVECLGNATHSVVATASARLARRISKSCEFVETLALPVARPAEFDDGLASALGGDLRLTWYEPDCAGCEAEGGMCGLKGNATPEIGCFYNPGKGGLHDGLQIFRIICLSIAVPAVTCAFGIACFACFVDRNNPTGARRSPTAVAAAPEGIDFSIAMAGLDDRTIESYEKLVLGESRRLPGPNDTTCPICLSEYCIKETLRCIPECEHCFHADCIDEWLRLNGTCPVCRNTPTPSPVHVSLETV